MTEDADSREGWKVRQPSLDGFEDLTVIPSNPNSAALTALGFKEVRDALELPFLSDGKCQRFRAVSSDEIAFFQYFSKPVYGVEP